MGKEDSKLVINVRLKGDVSDQLKAEPEETRWGFTVDDGDTCTYVEIGTASHMEECILKRDEDLSQLVYDGIRSSTNAQAHEFLDIVLEQECGIYINDDFVPHEDLLVFVNEEE